MTGADRPRLARVLAVLGETFNEPVSDLRAEGYYEGLKDLDIAAVEAGAMLALKTAKFFPRPAELREFALGNADDAAEIAWAELLAEVRRVGYLGTPTLSAQTMDAIRDLWGSWAHLCATLPGEGPELLGWMKQFQIAHKSVQRQGQRPELIGREQAKRLVSALITEAAKIQVES